MTDYQLVPTAGILDKIPSLVETKVHAFWGETWWRMLWGTQTRETIQARAESRLPHLLLQRRATQRHRIVIHRPTGEVVGYARWILPHEHSESWADARVPEPPASDRERYRSICENTDFQSEVDTSQLDPPVNEQMERLSPATPYIKLDYLAVHPLHQRRGVAQLLLDDGISTADKLRLPIFVLATSKRSLPLYLKSGFRLLWGLSQSLEAWVLDDTYETYILLYQVDQSA